MQPHHAYSMPQYLRGFRLPINAFRLAKPCHGRTSPLGVKQEKSDFWIDIGHLVDIKFVFGLQPWRGGMERQLDAERAPVQSPQNLKVPKTSKKRDKSLETTIPIQTAHCPAKISQSGFPGANGRPFPPANFFGLTVEPGLLR